MHKIRFGRTVEDSASTMGTNGYIGLSRVEAGMQICLWQATSVIWLCRQLRIFLFVLDVFHIHRTFCQTVRTWDSHSPLPKDVLYSVVFFFPFSVKSCHCAEPSLQVFLQPGRVWYSACVAAWRLGLPVVPLEEDFAKEPLAAARAQRALAELRPQAVLCTGALESHGWFWWPTPGTRSNRVGGVKRW